MKKPQLRDYKKLVYALRFGIELEAEFPEKIDIDQLRTRYRKLLNSWTVVTDGSLNNGLEFKPKDNNKLYFRKESLDEISEILHIIRKRRGKVDGKKCGFHVHIDASKLKSEEIIKIVKEMLAKQNFIVRDFKVDKNRLDNYCKKITKKDIRNLTAEALNDFRKNERIVGDSPILTSKYYMLNLMALQEHNTIEFRLFNGTKYIREIKKIIKYLFEFMIYALERD